MAGFTAVQLKIAGRIFSGLIVMFGLPALKDELTPIAV